MEIINVRVKREGERHHAYIEAIVRKEDLQALRHAEKVFHKIRQMAMFETRLDIIEEVIMEDFGLTKEEIRKKSRKHTLVLARHLYFYLAKRFTKLSLAQIGQYMGGRDHATVLHGIRKITNLIEPIRTTTGVRLVSDPELEQTAERLESKIYDRVFQVRKLHEEQKRERLKKELLAEQRRS